jgi:uncharacterized OB-fold protein
LELSAALDAVAYDARPRFDHDAGTLVGSRCPECGALSWPGRAVCQRCGAAGLETAVFGPTGLLVSHTRCWVARPGLETPFVMGRVRLDPGVTVFGHVRGLPEDSVRKGLGVRVGLGAEGAVPMFWFEAEEAVGDA